MDSLEIVLERSPVKYTLREKEAFAAEKNENYRSMLASLTESDVPEGVLPTLALLKKRGYSLALASASKNAPLILERTGLGAYLDAVADGNCVTRSKPDPEVFLVAAEKLGIAPGECAAVDDALAGVEAARAAGMLAVGYGDSAASGAGDINLERFSQLAEVFTVPGSRSRPEAGQYKTQCARAAAAARAYLCHAAAAWLALRRVGSLYWNCGRHAVIIGAGNISKGADYDKDILTGDNHIGLKYASHERASVLSSARLTAFEGMVSAANEAGCGLFVIAGDLFENTYGVPKRDVKSLVGMLEGFRGTVAVLPGNHDYYDSDVKVWQYFEDCAGSADNIVLMKEYRPYRLSLGEDEAVLYPAMCTSMHSATGENNLGWIKRAEIDGGCFNIGIAHGALEGETIDTEGSISL